MKQYIWGFWILILVFVLALWPASRGVWQISISKSAMWAGVSARKATDSIWVMMQLSKIDKKLKEVEEENLRLKSELAGMIKIKEENKILRKEINLVGENENISDFVSARVIGKSTANFLQTYTVDKGSTNGIEIGQTVIAQGYLVGKVKSVTPYTSTITIISSGQLTLPVALVQSKATGLVRGGLEGLIIEEIPLDSEVKQGELVITQDLEGVVVPGIAIGTIRTTIQHKGDIFQRAIAESPLDFSRIEIVLIVNNK